jgi:serine/threonine-protein kinase 24/25/MST4
MHSWRDDFDVLEQMNSASDGNVVYRGFDKRRKQHVAIKVIDLESCEETIEDLQKEITVLSQCKCERLTRCHGSYVTGSKLWVIMEYLGW